MTNFRSDLAESIHRGAPNDGLHESAAPGIYCVKFSESSRRTKHHWSASVSIIAQGCKEIVLGGGIYRCDREGHYIVAPLDLPVLSRVMGATPAKPFLALKIDFDPLILAEVAAQLAAAPIGEQPDPPRALFIGNSSELMLDSAARLARLLAEPEDARVLAPLVVREILYHLLKGPDGAAIRQFVRAGSKVHQIAQAIHRIRSDLAKEAEVAALAHSSNMSRSAFFKHFKEVTSMSPIQYQKRLRLLEARRLMIDEDKTAEGAAFKVGYNSASQFSREYSRMFGNAPLRDSVRIRATDQLVQQM